MKHPSEMTRRLPCGCVVGAYSTIERYCDKHYQQLLDERYLDEETSSQLPSLPARILADSDRARPVSDRGGDS